jgi:hypothetical protein
VRSGLDLHEALSCPTLSKNLIPKMKKLIILIVIPFFISCDVHIDEKTYQSKDITVKWYKVSTITSGHDFIDLERWGYTDNIMKANIGGIYDVKIIGDTILIKTLPHIGIYDLVAKKNECYIKLDSTVTTYEYMKKFAPENAKYFKSEDTLPSSENVTKEALEKKILVGDFIVTPKRKDAKKTK